MIPELVLLDLNLPNVSGIEVLRRTRSAPVTKLLPVIILTSSDEDRDMLTSYNLGANSFVRKPFDFTQFCDAIHQMSPYWLILNLAPKPGI